jgi:hypothetical protein
MWSKRVRKGKWKEFCLYSMKWPTGYIAWGAPADLKVLSHEKGSRGSSKRSKDEKREVKVKELGVCFPFFARFFLLQGKSWRTSKPRGEDTSAEEEASCKYVFIIVIRHAEISTISVWKGRRKIQSFSFLILYDPFLTCRFKSERTRTTMNTATQQNTLYRLPPSSPPWNLI